MPILQQNKNKLVNPTRTIVISFLLVIAVGAVLLFAPFSSAENGCTNIFTCIFTAASATCVTGITLVDTATHWTPFGQGVILALIQLGSMGFVTFISFFSMALGKKMGLRKIKLASESMNFSNSFSDVRVLLSSVFKISISVELIGALLLMPVFISKAGVGGIFTAVFISVSAFCNAGFDIIKNPDGVSSLSALNGNYYVMFIVMLLIICGSVGFVVWQDFIDLKKDKHIELHTKIVLITSAILIFGGALIFGLLEWNNPQTLGDMNIFEKITNCLFQSVTCRSAGFGSVDINECNPLTKIILMFLMYIGSASGSMGGGIKVTTFAVIVMTVVSICRGNEDTHILGRKIPRDIIYRSVALSILAAIFCFATSVLYYYTSEISAINASFTAVATFSTTGLTTIDTDTMSFTSKLWMVLMMFVGKVGPVSFVLSLTKQSGSAKNTVVPESRIIVG